MRSISGKDFAKALERHGWILLRSQAAITFMGNLEAAFASIPIHRNQNLKTGSLRHFMKVAGLTEKDLYLLSYKFASTKSVIICRMCFTSSGSVTPCRDFGYSIN